MTDLNKTLEDAYWNELAKEGITKDDLELIDLDLGYSPATPIKGSGPMEVIKLENNKYRIPDCPIVGLNISEQRLKVMRFRYLQNDPDRIRQRNAINNMFK